MVSCCWVGWVPMKQMDRWLKNFAYMHADTQKHKLTQKYSDKQHNTCTQIQNQFVYEN